MTWKHDYILWKYHCNLNMSEILQGVLSVNNFLELLLKYHFHAFMTSRINLIRFPLFQNICKNLFRLKYQQQA